VVIAEDGGLPRRCAKSGERLLGALAPPFEPAGNEVFVSASIGGAVYRCTRRRPRRCSAAPTRRCTAPSARPREVQLFGPEAAGPRVNR
jgi:hypothetical protein